MKFRDKYYFLSNMYQFDGDCVERRYQQAKCLYEEDAQLFEGLDGFQAKKLGKKITIRPDWNNIKVQVMEDLLRWKFSNKVLKAKLRAVKGPIIEENWWGDRFWGTCDGSGKNILGKILEVIRSEE